MFKKVLSSVLVLGMMISGECVATEGYHITESGGSASSVIILNVEPANVNCKTPIAYAKGIPCVVENLSNFPVLLESIDIRIDDELIAISCNKQIDGNSKMDVSHLITGFVEQRAYNLIYEINCKIIFGVV